MFNMPINNTILSWCTKILLWITFEKMMTAHLVFDSRALFSLSKCHYGKEVTITKGFAENS
jgi:hypothetical protein